MKNIEISKLPESWEKCEVNEIGDLIRGVTYKKNESSKTTLDNYLPILRANNINMSLNFDELVYVPIEKIKPEQIVKKFDVIIAMSSGSKHLVGKAAQAKEDFNGGFGTFCGLVRFNEKIDQQYAGYFFQSPFYQKLIQSLSSGVNINNLRKEHIENLEIPIPPLNEQKRIVIKIEELFTRLDAGVSELEKTKEQLKVYHQSLLKHAFEGKLTQEWRKAHKDELEPASELLERIKEKHKEQLGKTYKRLTSVDKSKLPELPEGWEWAAFGQIGALISGQHIKTADYNIDSVGLPYLTGPADFNEKYPSISKWTTKPKAKSIKNDVLVTVKGAGVGKVNILNIDEAAISRQLMAIRAYETNFDFIYLFIKTNFYYFQRLGSSTTVPGINRDQILNTFIPLPSKMEQDQIIDVIDEKLSVLYEISKNIDMNLVLFKNLRQSILKKAFMGELIPQDPNDEPAKLLLERIRDEKEKQKPKRKRRTRKKKVRSSQEVLM